VSASVALKEQNNRNEEEKYQKSSNDYCLTLLQQTFLQA